VVHSGADVRSVRGVSARCFLTGKRGERFHLLARIERGCLLMDMAMAMHGACLFCGMREKFLLVAIMSLARCIDGGGAWALPFGSM
jgi:hypothetical protein